MRVKTCMMRCDDESLGYAAELLRAGQLVAFPTETVYGLGADAGSSEAVARIFEAKERPADNPLIVHVASNERVWDFAERVPEEAERLIDAFWPGALTLVLPLRAGALPSITTAGLSTFAVRRPSHPVACALIERSGKAIAAPSANRSGRPSPTKASHVLEDMRGRIPLILDGGPCDIGVESTVVRVGDGGVELLRPGGVTVEMIERALGGKRVAIAQGVDEPLGQDEDAHSPGMKHRHYAPDAKMVVVDSAQSANKHYDEEWALGGAPVILCCDEGAFYGREVICLGDRPEQKLFSALRRADRKGATLIIFVSVSCEGMGRAVMNRALRAAGFWRE